MKALASALALVLVGLFGVWLWFDATSDAAQDTVGVVAVSTLEPEAVSTAQVPGQDGAPSDVSDVSDATDEAEAADAADAAARTAEEQLRAVDEVDDKVLAATVSSLRGVFDGVRVGSETLAADLRAAADDKAAAEAEQPAPQPAPAQPAPAPQPVPVQPAPSPGGPPGICWEWDDDDGWEWECDDDWDDDDWEDYWEDYYDD